jgi:hypothetical protein
MQMEIPRKNTEVEMLQELGRQIAIKFNEPDLRQRVLISVPGTPPSVPLMRAHARLMEIEDERKVACSRLKDIVKGVNPKQISELINLGIIDNIIQLLTYSWCPDDIKDDILSIITESILGGSDNQVRYLAKGCIPVLCEMLEFVGEPATLFALVMAIEKILSVGEIDIAQHGRNLYADSIKSCRGVEILQQLQMRLSGERDAIHSAIENILVQFRELEIVQSKNAQLYKASDRELGWRLLYPFIGKGHFPEWNSPEVDEPRKEYACPLKINLFISHRWEKVDNPDPNGAQFRSLIEYLSRVFMVSNSIISRDDMVIKELVIGDDILSEFREERLLDCRCNTDSYVNLRSVLGDDDLFVSRIDDIHRRRKFYKLLKHVHVWYDYSGLPQLPRSKREQEIFEYGLYNLKNVVNESRVLVLWGVESLDRAWCIFEAMVGKTIHFCSPSGRDKMSNFDKSVMTHRLRSLLPDENQASSLASYNGRNSLSILIAVKDLKKTVERMSEGEIAQYFKKTGVTCTNEEDLAIVANLIHRYLVEERADASS